MALSGIGSLFSRTGESGGTAAPDFSKSFIAKGADGEPYVKNPAKLWREVMDLKDDGLSNRKQHERLWALCWMFYKGDQWRKPAPQPDWNIIRINVGKKPKITINKILPMVQTRRAHVLKNRPTGIVMPATIDEEDRNAARIAQDILDYDQQHLKNWDILDGKLSLTMFVTGNAFKKIYWDPTKGEKKEKNRYKVDPNTGAPVIVPEFIGGPDGTDPTQSNITVPSQTTALPMNMEAGSSPKQEEDNESLEREGATPNPDPNAGGPVSEGVEEEPEGDIVIEFVPPEEIIPEPSATCLEDCERILHRTLKPIKWVKDTYGDAAEDVQPVNMKSDRGKALAQGAKLFGLNEREVANRCEVLEAWYRPSEDYPEGLHAVWADDKLLAAGPTPEAHEHIPFIHYKEIETDEFWGISSVSQTIDPQKALNLAVSRDEFMRQRLRPKLIAATDSGLDESAYSNDDSEIVFVQHPFYPKFTEPPAFQRDEKAVGYFASAIDDIGGSADVMRGQVNGGDVRSGRMVNYLQEYAGTVLSGPARSIEQGEEVTGNMILRLRKHYTNEPRLYYIVGRNRSVEVRQFIGSDIEGCADYVVQAGSALPMSMAEKRDLVLSMVEKGIMAAGDPRIIKMMGMPSDVDQLFNEDQLDRDNATQEDHNFLQMKDEVIGEAYGIQQQKLNLNAQAQGIDPGMMEQMGIKPQPAEILHSLKMDPRDFENHIVHLETHNRTRKSDAYRKLSDAAKALFDEHCDLHAQFLLPPPGPPAPEGAGGHPGMPAGPQQGGAHKPPPGAGGPPGEGGGPAALNGGQPPGKGGAGNINAEGNREKHQGMPPSRRAPMNNAHHLK
jgi:hypothetical protein